MKHLKGFQESENQGPTALNMSFWFIAMLKDLLAKYTTLITCSKQLHVDKKYICVLMRAKISNNSDRYQEINWHCLTNLNSMQLQILNLQSSRKHTHI